MYVSGRLHADAHGLVGVGLKFERIRRITGYLVGTLDRFNDAKRQEVNDRAVHQSFKHMPQMMHQPAAAAQAA